MPLSKKRTATYLAKISIVLIFITLFFQYLQHNLILNRNFSYSFFNSDALFFNVMSESIISGKSTFSDWILTGAPRLFPSIILNLIIFTFIKNYFIGHIIVGLMQLLLFNILIKLLIETFTSNEYSLLTILMINFFLFSTISIEPFSYVLISSHHFDNFLNFLFCCLLFFKGRDQRPFSIFYYGMFIFLASFSNPIFLATFSAPFFFSNIIFYKHYKFNLILKDLFLIFMSIAGIVTSKIIFSHNDCNVCFDNTYQNMSNISFDAIYISLYHIKEFFLSHSSILQNSCFTLSILTPTIYIINKLYKSKFSIDFYNKKIHFFTFIIFAIIINTFCFIFLKINPQFRHLYLLYFNLFMVIPISLFPFIKSIIKKYYFNISMLALILSLLLFFTKFDYFKKVHFNFYPDDIQFIDKTLEEYDISHGFVPYSYGNRLIFLSRIQLSMIHFHKIKPIHLWINKKWIEKEPEYIINLDPIDFGFSNYKTISNKNISIHILE